MYLIEPSFYNIHNIQILELFIVVEKLFKIFVMFLFVLFCFKKNLWINDRRFIIFAFLIITDLSFSLGTFNWGTAFRHQVITFGLLTFLIAFVYEEVVVKKNE